MRRVPSPLRFSGPPPGIAKRVSVGLSVFMAVAAAFSFAPPAAAESRAEAGAASADELVLDLGGATLETIKVTHGVFMQGAAPVEAGHEKDEEPAHQVTITRDFWIGKFPITRGQFAKFVADTRYVTDAEKGQSGGSGWDGKPVDGGKAPGLVQRKDFTWRNPGFTQTDAHPVVLVSYGDALAFVGWASRKTGKRVRLPTEAEWEFAARAGTTTAWSGGAAAEADPAAYGWFKPNAGNGTRPVGQKKPNPLGIFDMSGNVMEWCRDVYAPYREGAVVDPEISTITGNEPERRVLRGGSWFRDPKRGRSAARYRSTPGSRNADNGFRVVVTNEEAVVPAVTGPASGVDFVPASPVGLGGNAGAGASPGGVSSAAGATPGGPLADGEPMHVDPVGHSSEAFSWGVLLAAPLASASAVVAWMLLRRKRRPGGVARAKGVGAGAAGRAHALAGVAGAANALGVSTRSAADGFFVSAPGVTPGSRLRYACMVDGAEVSDVVPLDGGTETFVYTGSSPTAIRVLEVIAGARGRGAADRPPPVPVSTVATQSVPVLTAQPPFEPPSSAPNLPSTTLRMPSSAPNLPSTTLRMPSNPAHLPPSVPAAPASAPTPPSSAPSPPSSVPAAPSSAPAAPPSVPAVPPSVPAVPPSVPAAPPSVPRPPPSAPRSSPSAPRSSPSAPGMPSTPRPPSSAPRPPRESPRLLLVPFLDPDLISDASSSSDDAPLSISDTVASISNDQSTTQAASITTAASATSIAGAAGAAGAAGTAGTAGTTAAASSSDAFLGHPRAY